MKNNSRTNANMQTVVILLCGIHLSFAATHSLHYFYTAVSGGINFPEFTAVGLVDNGQFMYFDSNTMKAVPKTEWMRQNVGADYWDRETQSLIGTHQVYKNNIQVAKERFNQSAGVHTAQEMYGCEWDDETEATNGFNQHGYDGEDFLNLDLKNLRYISPAQQGFITQQKLNNDRALLEGRKHYLKTVCIEWLKKYLQFGKSSLEKTVSPQVSLLQKDSSSPVTCHATGFYPSGVKITWMKNGEEHHEDVELDELLPNEDGTFQKTSTLTVTPDEWKNNNFSCLVKHMGIRKQASEIRTNYVSPQVSLLQKDPSSPVTCHATGFYPSGVTITWMKNGEEHHEDVELGELLPNEDGTFQKTSTLRVTPDEWKNNKFSCLVKHKGINKEEREIRTNNETGNSLPIGIIVGVVVAVVLLVGMAGIGYKIYQKKKKDFKPVSGSDDGSNSSKEALCSAPA